MADKITLAGSLRWMRDKFGEWFANTTAFSFMWLSVGFAVAVLFVWDGVWATHQAPAGMELSYRAAGWALRLWVVFSLVGVVALFRRGAWGTALPLLVTWILASIMTYGHAVGFMATGQMQRYANAQVVTDVESVVTTSVTDQIATLERQKDSIRTDRETDVKALEDALRLELDDGRANNDDAAREKYTTLITNVRDEARARIESIDSQIMGLMQSSQTASTEAREDSSEVIAFDPLYIWIAHARYGTGATDAQIRSIASIIGAFWAFLVEMLAGAGPAILYAAHAHFAKRSDMPGESYSEDVPPGTVNINMTEEEWAEYERAKEVHGNLKQGAEKGARTRRRGRKIKQAGDYSRNRVLQAIKMRQDGLSIEEIAELTDQSVDSWRMSYAAYIESEEEEAILFGEVEEPVEEEADEPDEEFPLAAAE